MDNTQELSDIQRFYKNSTVFLTGATGFIGKLFLEKVLRALPVKKVFILVRSKKNVPAAKRFQEIFESPVFDGIKRTSPDAISKVFIIEGDCALPMLGMSEEDQKLIVEEVNVVFHVAATTRFDEHIQRAVLTNVRSTKDLITLAKQVKNLKIFVYTGTAFSNCIKKEIKEEVYPAKITAEKLIAACENLDADTLESATNALKGEWPNTYTFTKQVTEDYISREANGIPICITRPAVVISTMNEPVTAFVDNVFTLAGFVLCNAMGLCRITYYKNTVLDIIPADLVVNECIAAGWQTAESFKPYKSQTAVYNISTVLDNPITQDQVYDACDYYARMIPTPMLTSYPLYFRTTCKYNYLIIRLFVHTFVAHIIDFVLIAQGKKPMYVKAIEKLHKFQASYEYFNTNAIYLHVDNTHRMLKKMSFKDRELFNCDVTTINWDNYFSKYLKGLRFYILKDPMSTLPEGIKKYNYLRNIMIVGLIFLLVTVYFSTKFLLFKVFPVVFGFALYFLRSIIC